MKRILAVLAMAWPAALFASEPKWIAIAFFENQRVVVEALLSESECLSLSDRIRKLGPQTTTIKPFDKTKPGVTGRVVDLQCMNLSGTKRIRTKP